MTATQTEKPASELSPGSQTAVETARERLRAGHQALAEARRSLDAATAASERARQFVVGAVERRDKFRDLDRAVAVDRSQEVKAALLAGRAPTFTNAAELSRNAVALAEAQSRVDAASIACADIETAEGEAARVMNAAKDEVRASADALLAAMADAAAMEIEELEGRAVQMRIKLGGGQFAPISTAVRGVALSPAVMRVLAGTDRLEFQHNSPSDLAVKAAARGWLRLIEELMTDPDAELRFDASAPVSLAAE